MYIGHAIDLVSRYDSLRNPLTSLNDYLDPELISRCLEEAGTVTLRKPPPAAGDDGLVHCRHGA